MAEVSKYAREKKKDMGLEYPQKLPNKKWLIQVLGIFKPDHEIFKKDYLPQIKEITMVEKVVDN